GGDLIGQFGVGFYSSFMVADSVEVVTRGYRKNSEHLIWRSGGDGVFEITKGKGHRRGTKVVVSLREDAREYSDPDVIRDILRKYSAFVPFPLKLNGEQINTTEAVWLRSKSEITDQEYGGFYRFQTNSFDEPRYRLHFSSEAPIDMNVLLFVSEDNMERLGFGRMDPGVSLYSRRVLIDASPNNLLPEWARFLKGVVDSADIPLNISRETMQDSSLVRKLNSAITKRFIKFLEQNSADDPESYGDFYGRFGLFIKEGVASDFEHKEQLRGLLRFSSSRKGERELVSFEDYLSGMREGQEEIYYLFGSARDTLSNGPHMEFFRSEDIEVLFIYEPIDEFVMLTLGEYKEKKIVSADSVDVGVADKDAERASEGPSEEEKSLCGWMKGVLGERVGDVRMSRRLVESPAAAFNSDSTMTQGMKRIMRNISAGAEMRSVVRLEINGDHALIKNLASMREKDTEFAAIIVEQLFDNALLAAGYME
ncbi:MAG: molecular chaperone HtpG, partial [Candidatus Dadabacteria bacterium]|nr:molecular chaperone HtpG [Candidatus Dadabacteria bacterium]